MSARTTATRPKTTKPVSSAPVQLKSRSKASAREALFSIDGVDYTMPVAVELGDSLLLARVLRVQPDEDSRGIELVRHLCGQEALNALLGDATMTRAEWKHIVKLLAERAFGPQEQREDDEGN